MSVTVDKRVIPPGEDDLLSAAWDLKERIRDDEDLLKQRWGFFADAYRRSTVYAFLDEDDLIGFAAARRDGYLLFLAVAPAYRNEGFGERLVACVAEDHGDVTCHARTTNQNALDFYTHLGFSIVRRIDDYYEDGASAYYLRLGDSEDLLERISEFFRQ
ncbi:MAG: GNAT family N-acetyltransferase [Halanaeroarchaeum sp.]